MISSFSHDAFAPSVMESKALLDAGFHVLYMFLFVELVVWIPIVSGILDFTKINFPDFGFYSENQEGRNLDSFTWGDTFYMQIQ